MIFPSSYFQTANLDPRSSLFGLTLRSIGAINYGPEVHKDVCHQSNANVLAYLHEGRGRFFSKQGRISLEPGCLMFMRSTELHHYQALRGSAWKESYIMFSLDSKWSEELPSHGVMKDMDRAWEPNFFDLHHCFQTNDPFGNALVSLFAILQNICNSRPPRGETEDGLDRIIQRMEEMPQQNWDLQHCAQELKMSYSLFRKRFLERTGLPPRRFVLREKINLACRLLDGGRNIQDSARQCGYDDLSQFSKLFKHISGQSPRDYRRHQGWSD